MASVIGKISKPEAQAYKKGRKLFLIPMFIGHSEDMPELQALLERFWSEADEHLNRLEESLGTISRIYHETVYASGEEGQNIIGAINPKGSEMLNKRYNSGAHIEPTEDRELMEISSDWQRCLSIGLFSQNVRSIALDAYQASTRKRYEYVASRINESLMPDESAVLVISQNHGIQFPSDIEVFYVAPRALNDLHKWIDNWVRNSSPTQEKSDVEESNS